MINMTPRNELYSAYRKQQNRNAEVFFAKKGFQVQPKYSYILKDRINWAQNILVPLVTHYIEKHKQLAETEKVAFPLHKFCLCM